MHFLVACGFLFSLSAMAFQVQGVEVDDWEKEILVENEFLAGEFSSETRLPGNRCASVTSQSFKGSAELSHIDIVPVEGSPDAMDFIADLSHLKAAVKARHASDSTYCLGVRLATHGGAEGLHARTRVTIPNQDLSLIEIEVKETVFTALHLAKPLPSFYQELMTDLVNLNLERLWQSELGAWINAKITAEIRKRLGENDQYFLGPNISQR